MDSGNEQANHNRHRIFSRLWLLRVADEMHIAFERGPMFESWIIDFRYASRRLRSRPTFAALAVLTIALGAGGTAAIFSVVRPLLLDPLPITDEARIAVLWFQA